MPCGAGEDGGGMTSTTPMVRVPAGEFVMGSSDFYPDEGPRYRVRVPAFELDEHPVSNAEFAAFIGETDYITVAERPLDPEEFPGLPPRDLAPGGLVFTPSSGPVDLGNWRQWWRWAPGACWRQPLGPGSSIEGREDHPAVQLSFADAGAYSVWAGKRLPDEAEWEFASRGGLSDAFTYAWGTSPARTVCLWPTPGKDVSRISIRGRADGRGPRRSERSPQMRTGSST